VTEFARRGRAAGHLPFTVYALVCRDTGNEWEFDSWDDLRMYWGKMERSQQLRCSTVLRSVWRR